MRCLPVVTYEYNAITGLNDLHTSLRGTGFLKCFDGSLQGYVRGKCYAQCAQSRPGKVGTMQLSMHLIPLSLVLEIQSQ